MKKVLLAALATTMIAGCVQRVGDFTVASTKNIDIGTGIHTVDSNTRVDGRDTVHIVFVFPTKMWPDMKEAMDNAIEKSPEAVGLSNVTIKHGSWYIPLIYGQEFWEVEGNPIYAK